MSLIEIASRRGEMYATFLLGKLRADGKGVENKERRAAAFYWTVLNEFSRATRNRMEEFRVSGNFTEDEVCFSLGK